MVKALYFFAVVLVCLPGLAIADDVTTTKEEAGKTANPPIKQRRPSGGYCGIYCLYAVMKLSDIDVDPKELLKPEYISSRRGSSLAELKKAAEDNGLYAVPVGKLTSRVLRSCPHQIILHVKSAADKKEYDHYELFLETKEGQARLYDPPEPVRLVPFRELAPRWDGTGLIVSASPIDLGPILAPARKRFIMYAAIAAAIVLIVHWGRRRWPASAGEMTRHRLLRLSIAQGVGFAIAALFFGMLYHFANDEAFLANPNAIASIQQAHLGNFIPKINKKKVERILNTNAVFIDARFPPDFKEGHLEAAINIPVNASDDERQKTMAAFTKDASIVVYSQSAGCKFAEKVAIKLISDGFSNVSIFKGGWREWKAESGK
jgi:rhodanese-related sulfurtransferase